MAIPVKLPEFEGPLDLLLHLIDKNKVDIFDIPIAEITDQYLAYVSQMKEETLDVMSEFLVMAATLLEIKSRMLLPAEKNEEGEEIDPRDELVRQLLEYKMYRELSYELRLFQEDAGFTLYRDPAVPAEVKAYREPVDIEELLKNVTLSRLQSLFEDILRRQEERMDPVRSKFGTLEKEEVDLNATMEEVETYIRKARSCTFHSLLVRRKSRSYTVAAFLTLLELMKEGKVEVEQDGIFSEIRIVSVA